MKKVLVLKGGISTEREISLKSGAAVASALGESGFFVEELDLTGENLNKISEISPDVVFLVLHGKGGEDGTIQGYLDWLKIPYTGSGVAASALCMDKILTKKILRDSGIPTPRFLEILQSEAPYYKELAEKAVETLGLPLVLKACCQGSSIGVSIVRKKEDAASALRELFSFGDSILAEEFLPGMELTVPILGTEELLILPVIEITSKGEFYDFESKYAPGGSEHIIPARISDETTEKVKKIAERAYRAAGCRGYARVDLMLAADGEPYVIEINTAPGMTSTSLFPDAARAAGISFPELVKRMVELSF